MAVKVINEGEVYLGGYKYAIDGKVRRRLKSGFPNKIITGDYSYDNQEDVSSWIINDQTGGALLEEMDITNPAHAKRYYWSNLNTTHRGHMVLPPLATSIGSVSKVSPTGHTDGGGVWSNETNAYDGNLTTDASVSVGGGGAAWSDYLQLSRAATNICGIALQLDRSDASVTQVDIDYTINGTDWVDVFADNIPAASLTGLYVWAVAASGVTQIRVRGYCTGAAGGQNFLLSEAYLLSTSATHTTFHTCNFNSNLYFGVNDILCKLESTAGATVTPLKIFGANITGLVSTIGSQMVILQGDSTAFWYMSTAEAFTQTDETGATYGIDWSGKFFWIDDGGDQISHASALAATLIETDAGTLDVPDAYVKQLILYRDASGNEVIYAVTRTGLYAYDFANTKFLITGATWADNANVGLACQWQGSLWIPVGQDVIKYTAGAYATVEHKGLAQDDGLAAWDSAATYITCLIPGDYYIYALTHGSGTGLTGVYKTNGTGWFKQWGGGTSNYTSGIISAVYASRLWFDYNNLIYYIAEQATNMRPGKISGYTYADDSDMYASHITSLFNAGSRIYPKLATKLQLYTSGCSSTETISTQYDIDTPLTSILTGWTTLGTITSNGITEYTFGTSGVGIVFYDIRFRFNLVRGSTNTSSPDLQGAILSYLKLISPRWQFQFTIDCARGQYAPQKMEDLLITAAETQTLLEFTYRGDEGTGETYYVKILPLNGIVPTGKNHQAKYQVTVWEP